MTSSRKYTRLVERIKINLPLRVHYRESVGQEWVEESQISELAQNGAGFLLKRPVEPGRLIHLTLPMPRKFRVFDYLAEEYRIWAVVRYVRMLQPDISDAIRVNVGTAFIGKTPPASFLQNPKTRYDLKPVLMKDKLWDVREMPRNAGRFAQQREPRFPVTASVTIDLINESGQITICEQAEIQNISESGAAVLTKIIIESGRFVRFTSKNHCVSLLSIVRNCHKLETAPGFLLNLEFISDKWAHFN